jgi:hypothetical protein
MHVLTQNMRSAAGDINLKNPRAVLHISAMMIGAGKAAGFAGAAC